MFHHGTLIILVYAEGLAMTQRPDPFARTDRYRHVEFAGDEITAIVLDDGVAVPVRTICQALGLESAGPNPAPARP